jgi:hypothetical protein
MDKQKFGLLKAKSTMRLLEIAKEDLNRSRQCTNDLWIVSLCVHYMHILILYIEWSLRETLAVILNCIILIIEKWHQNSLHWTFTTRNHNTGESLFRSARLYLLPVVIMPIPKSVSKPCVYFLFTYNCQAVFSLRFLSFSFSPIYTKLCLKIVNSPMEEFQFPDPETNLTKGKDSHSSVASKKEGSHCHWPGGRV